MSSLNYCGCPSPTTITVAVPGPEGDGGTLPVQTTADFIIPAIGADVTVAVTSNSGFRNKKNVFCYGSNFMVNGGSGGTSVVLKFLGFSGDGAPGATVPAGSLVIAGVGNVDADSLFPNAAAAAIADFTDNTGGSASNTLTATTGVYDVSFPVTIVAGTAAADYLTNIVLGHKFKILAWYWVTSVAVAGASGSRVFNMEINTTDVGTVASTCTVTTASNATIGSLATGTAVSGANTGSATDTFSIEVASGGTTITGGSGYFVVRIQNMDTADSVASIADKINDILAAIG